MLLSKDFSPCALRFRRFSGKAYAAFCSMHRVVTIGRVGARIANLEMLKAGRSILLCAAAFVGGIMYADEPPIEEGTPMMDNELLTLSQVEVVAQRAEVQSSAYRLIHTLSHDEIAQLPVRTVSDLLSYVPGVDVRTRGANGSQADISMRGGTFDQVLVLINGVNLTDAHTGHYSLNLPIDVALIERVEIMQGTSASLFGLNAFAGAINIITRSASPQPSSLSARLTSGMYNLWNASVSGRYRCDDWYVNGTVSYLQADGYRAPGASEKEQTAMTNSDYRLANVYLQMGFRRAVNQLDVQLGAQYKDAGAGMFYGFGSQDQFDATRTAFGSATYTHRWGPWSMDVQAMYRANYDRYEWHRSKRQYGNFHFTQNAAANVKLHYASELGQSTIGLEVRNENIHSTNLGDTIRPNGQVPNVDGFNLRDLRVLDLVRGDNRLNVNYFAEQSFVWRDLTAALGVSGSWNSQFGHNIAGGANIGYAYARTGRVYINANRSLRLPTFTDLYYDAGNQLGNRDLQPEKAWVLSVGTQYTHSFGNQAANGKLSLALDWYYRWGRDIIDWVYTPDDTRRPYHAQNWDKVDATGLEFSAQYQWNEWIRSVSVNYAYTYLDLDVNRSGSRYLDYLSHKLTLGLNHGIWVSHRQHLPFVLGANWNVRFQKREGEFNNAEGVVCSYAPFWLLDAGLYWECAMVRVSVDCTNVTNRHYYDYGGILQPGAWAKLTAEFRL